MSQGLDGHGLVWSAVLERFERHAPASVMACVALEHALPAGWVDEVFEAHRQQQYSRELLFSTVVELMTLVSLGLRPSLHTAARQMPGLPVSLASLYDKVNHTEPGTLGALVRGIAERLGPAMAAVRRCCRGQRESELVLPWRCLGDLDGDGFCRPDHAVQHCDGDGDLTLLCRQAPGAQLRADQVFVARHGRLGLIAPAVSCRPLPSHAAALGHKPDVAVARASSAAVARVRTWDS